MATEKPRFSVTFTDESYKKIHEYQKANKISTQSKAVARLVEIALNKLECGDLANLSEIPLNGGYDGDELKKVLLGNFNQLNAEGQEKLVDTSDDMVASGKYIKSNTNPLGEKNHA